MNSEIRRALWLSLILLAFAAWTKPAQADRSTIKRPSLHPDYFVELEPHLVLGFVDIPGRFSGPGKGVGPGVRATFELVDNGFIRKINNTVGLSIGADLLMDNKATFVIPVAMQWNFWLSENWSVFGEPGFTLAAGKKGGFGLTLYGGGRLLLTRDSALVFRVGHPTMSIGYAFLM